MRPTTRRAAKTLAFILAVFLLPPSTRSQEIQLRSSVELVVVPVTAKDKQGNLALGLAQSDFTVTEAGKKQTLTAFSVEPMPLSAAVLIDTGISEAALTRVKNSFPALLGAFADSDEVAVFRFDKHVEKLMDFSSDRVLINKTLDKLTAIEAPASSVSSGPFSSPGPVINGVPITPGVDSVGRTIAPPTKVLHDALFEAAEDLAARPVDRRRIILVASDGRNQNSLHSYSAARNRLLLREVHVFAFGLDTSLFQRFRSDLLSYTKETGGDSCFAESQSDLESCYFLSTEEARNQYVLGYVSSNPRPRGQPVFREIKVRVDRPGIELSHRKGYYQSP